MIGIVRFVGAGPGDPELVTVKGVKALENAALVVYAGSLVPRELLEYAPLAEKRNSASMTLAETHAIILDYALKGKNVVRLHSGDPSIFGALREQTDLLDEAGIPWEVIPGVTSACALAARAGVSLTAPESCQSVILTRSGGRTVMPECLEKLAAHEASLGIYLSAGKTEKIQDELSRVLKQDTPVLCGYKISLPEEEIVWTTLGELNECAATHGFKAQTLFLVLPALLKAKAASRLYDGNFSHKFRIAK